MRYFPRTYSIITFEDRMSKSLRDKNLHSMEIDVGTDDLDNTTMYFMYQTRSRKEFENKCSCSSMSHWIWISFFESVFLGRKFYSSSKYTCQSSVFIECSLRWRSCRSFSNWSNRKTIRHWTVGFNRSNEMHGKNISDSITFVKLFLFSFQKFSCVSALLEYHLQSPIIFQENHQKCSVRLRLYSPIEETRF